MYAGVYVCVCCVHTSPTVGGLVADCLYSDQNSNMHSLCRSNADTVSIYGADCVFRFCFLPGVITGKDTSVRFSSAGGQVHHVCLLAAAGGPEGGGCLWRGQCS